MSDESASRTLQCYVCGDEIDVQEDEWWSHSWEEQPAKETVEKAIEEKDFRDWFRENKVFCSDCHKELMVRLSNMEAAV